MAEDPNPSSQTQLPHIYRPIPRRHFSNPLSHLQTDDSPQQSAQDTPPPAPASPQDTQIRASDFLTQLNARLLRTASSRGGGTGTGLEGGGADGGGLTGRNKSFLNMTSSTLYGIYDEIGGSTTGERSVADTPWGTGAETPARRLSEDEMATYPAESGLGSPDAGLKMKEQARRGTISRQRRRPTIAQKPQRHGVWRATVIAGKLASLFLFGVVYGVIVSHLHDTRELAAVQVGGVDSESWTYYASWGIAGIALGSLLPYVDLVSGVDERKPASVEVVEEEKGREGAVSGQWNEVVRSVGAFMGIAFAIRRLPWQSTLQLTLTLALVNPALWYILDRSKNGLSFSLITTSVLTSFIFLSNPDVLPSPALPATTTNSSIQHVPAGARPGLHQQQQQQGEMFAGVVSYDSLATATWVGSVIFCSCICFGGIGRRLAVLEG